LTDAEFHVHEMMVNVAKPSAIVRGTAIAVVLLVFGVTCLIAAVLGLGIWPLVGFVASALIYCVMLRVGLFNEIEGALVCEVFLILGLVLMPAINKVVGD
jgi:hypothetical protein